MRRVTGSASPIRTILFRTVTSPTWTRRSLVPHSRELSMVSCNLVFFKEAKRKPKEEDTHSLRYRFRKERTILPASDLQDHIQLRDKCSLVSPRFNRKT